MEHTLLYFIQCMYYKLYYFERILKSKMCRVYCLILNFIFMNKMDFNLILIE